MAQEFEGLYVKFGANTVEFDNSVKGMNSALSTLKKDLQTLNKNLKFDPSNVDLLAKKMQNFQQQVDIGNKKIAELRRQQKDLGDDKIGTAEWQKLESEIGKTEAQMQVVNRAIDETQKKLNQFKPGTVEYALRKIDEETQNLEKSLKLLDKELQLDPTNVEKLNQKFGMLERSAELSQEKVALLKKEQDKLGDSELNSKEWQRLESEIDDAENALADAKIEMKNVSDELKDVADNAEEAAKEAEKLAEELKAVTPGNIEHVNKKLDEMADKAQKTADKVGKIKDGFEKAGNAAKPFSALAVAGLGASAVAAGNLQEQTAKTGAVFKEQTKEMDTFAKSSLENFNMAENTSREIMNTYGAMGSGLGLTAKENAKLAKSLTGLTADTVAFNDVSADRAKTALKGIYTGETESLKELGVVMTQANLENYAMNNGITTSIKDMTEAEKVTLRYNYVMDAMADAQGAAKREQDSFNGQIRYFKEQLIEIATRIGEQMMPVLEDLLQKVNKFVEKIAGLDDKGFKNIALALVAIAGVAPLLLGVGKILGFVQSALMGWSGALKAIKGSKFALFLAKTFGTATTGPIIGVILAITGVILAIGIALKQVWDESESFRNAMKEVFTRTKENIEYSIDRIVFAVKSFISSNKESIDKAKAVWEGFKKVIEFVATVIGRTIEFISTVIAGLSTIFSGALRDSDKSVKIGLEMIKLAFEKFISQVKTAFYKTDWKGIGKTIMNALYSGISGLAQTLYNLFIKIVNKLVEIAKKIDWVGLGKTVMTFILNGISAISGLLWQTAQKIFNSMLDLIKKIDWLTLGKNVMDFIIKGISALASTLWQVVQKLFYTALDYIKNINWDNLGQTLMRLIIKGISTLGSMIWNTLKGIFSGAKNNSEKSIDWLGIGLTIINMIVQGITVLMGVIWKTLRGALTEAWRSAKNIDWASIGSAIINGITSRVSSIGSNIWNSIRNALNNAKEWARNISWSSVGGSIVNGIVSGITGLAGKIRDKIVSAFNTAKSWTSGLWDNITGKRSFDMQFSGNVVPNMQRMAMPTMGNYYNPVVATNGHSINISVDARGDNADMIARRVERAIVRRIQS